MIEYTLKIPTNIREAWQLAAPLAKRLGRLAVKTGWVAVRAASFLPPVAGAVFGLIAHKTLGIPLPQNETDTDLILYSAVAAPPVMMAVNYTLARANAAFTTYRLNHGMYNTVGKLRENAETTNDRYAFNMAFSGGWFAATTALLVGYPLAEHFDPGNKDAIDTVWDVAAIAGGFSGMASNTFFENHFIGAVRSNVDRWLNRPSVRNLPAAAPA